MFWNYYVLKLLHLETITFSDATLSDINVVLCYVLSQYHYIYYKMARFLLPAESMTSLVAVYSSLLPNLSTSTPVARPACSSTRLA
jgi:hypothetical protein